MTPVTPIASGELLSLLVQLSTLLLLALLLGRLAVRLGHPPILGELMAGVILGPTLLGSLSPTVQAWLFPPNEAQMHMLDAVAFIGVLLLVGVSGLSLSLATVRRRLPSAAQVSCFGLVVPMACGVALGLLAPAVFVPATTERPIFALFLAVAMGVTAIPVIAKTLTDMKLIHRDIGQLILTAGMIDDTVAWLLLSLVSTMATVGLQTHHVGRSILYLVLFVLFAIFIGRKLVGWSVGLAARSADATAVIAAATGAILLGATATHALHMEAVLGAFVAGILLGELPTQYRQRLAPLRTVVLGVLAPLFLATAGLRVDLTVLAEPMMFLAAGVVMMAAVLGKLGGAYAGARLARMGHWEGVAVGAGMNARGVVEIVVATVGLRLGVLDETSFTIITLVAIGTSLMAPPLLRYAMARVAATADEELRRKHLDEEWGTGGGPPTPSAAP